MRFKVDTSVKKILFVKPPDSFLDDEFVYQQLAPHYLQSFLHENGFDSDLAVLHDTNHNHSDNIDVMYELSAVRVVMVAHNGRYQEYDFDIELFNNYDIVAMSVMSPQAPAAYELNKRIKNKNPHIITVIGGSHARYYLSSVCALPEEISFDFVVPNDGWGPMLDIANGVYRRGENDRSIVLSHEYKRLVDIPPPTRPEVLMKKYQFEIAGVPAFHLITALGCPFSCNFCESGKEKIRKFSDDMVDSDLRSISEVHDKIGNDKKGIMIFDDVGLMNPRQTEKLSGLINKNGFDVWRAFSHAFLVDRYGSDLLSPFYETGGRRVGLGLETGSQKSLDLLNKRNGQQQYIEEHFRAVEKANDMGIAVDAFTMIYPWENEDDLLATTKLIEFIIKNPVKGVDEKGRRLMNNVDSTIMTPYQGTAFNDMIILGKIPGVEIKKNIDPGLLYYKGSGGGSGWPYTKTVLKKERYEEEQEKRLSLRARYR